MLHLQGVAVHFAGFVAVEDINFDVPDGQFVAVVGPTGCGKSSLLNLVAGLLRPARGNVSTGGHAVNAVNTQCGYMFQVDALLPWRTALDNVLLGPLLRGTPKPQARALAGQWQQNPRTAQALARVAVATLKYINAHSAEEIAAKLPGQLF
ncbi:MAG: ATP-binding cassette domain-containing protein, partial [Chloroflexota bacterium]|nr:ATP-binding cassette domain-containing protein [Chloroflexota bacterium]